MGRNADIQPRVQTIDELCEECAALIEHHDKIQLLSMVQGNLRKTLVDVENIAELPQEAAAAEELLADNTQLLQVVEIDNDMIEKCGRGAQRPLAALETVPAKAMRLIVWRPRP